MELDGGLALGTRGSRLPQGPTCPRCSTLCTQLRLPCSVHSIWQYGPSRRSFIRVFRTRTHANLRTQTLPKCFSSASGNCSSCFRSCLRAPFSQASCWRAGNSPLIKCLENPPPWGQHHVWNKRAWCAGSLAAGVSQGRLPRLRRFQRCTEPAFPGGWSAAVQFAGRQVGGLSQSRECSFVLRKQTVAPVSTRIPCSLILSHPWKPVGCVGVWGGNKQPKSTCVVAIANKVEHLHAQVSHDRPWLGDDFEGKPKGSLASPGSGHLGLPFL